MTTRLLLVLALLALAAPAALAGSGGAGLRQVQCISPARGCTHGLAVSNPTGAVAFGRTVYVRNGVGSLGTLGVFARNLRTHRLTQIQCVARRAKPCTDGRGLETPAALAVSPDGRNVYVAAANGRSVGVYARAGSGKLASRGSVTGLGRPHAVVVSPDGRYVYVGGDRLWTFGRAADGSLTLAATTPAPAQALAVSPDGSTLYAGAGGGHHGTLTAYARDPDSGALAPSTTLDSTTTRGIQQPSEIVATRGGVYVAGAVSGAVTRYDAQLANQRIATGLPRAFGLTVSRYRVYVAYRRGLAVFDTGLRRLGTAPLTEATGVAAAGRGVYAASQHRITAYRR